MLGLSPAQVAGSALAAVSGALLASFAGAAGTIIGTAVGSVVATVGGAIYTWSLKRSSDAVRRTAAQVRQNALLAGAVPRTVAEGPMRSKDDTGPETPAEEAAEAAEAEATQDAGDESVGRSLPWRKLALASLAVTVVALGGITTFEAVTGQPISSLVGGGDSEGTSVGNIVRREESNPSKDKQQPTEPTERTERTEPTKPGDDASPEPEPDTQPSEEPVEPDSTVVPTPEPDVPSGEPSVVPEEGSEGAPAAEPGTEPEAEPSPAP